MSAEIVPFPSRIAAAAAAKAGQDRLQRALASLDDALASQRAAVAEWRATLAQLGATMHGLGASLHGYRGSLTRLETQVGALNQDAVALEHWADTVLAGQER